MSKAEKVFHQLMAGQNDANFSADLCSFRLNSFNMIPRDGLARAERTDHSIRAGNLRRDRPPRSRAREVWRSDLFCRHLTSSTQTLPNQDSLHSPLQS